MPTLAEEEASEESDNEEESEDVFNELVDRLRKVALEAQVCFVHYSNLASSIKVRCVFPMVIWSEFRMGQQRYHDHQEDAPHFIPSNYMGSQASKEELDEMDDEVSDMTASFYTAARKDRSNSIRR